MKKEKIRQRQKNTKGIKTSYIWDELNEKYGIFDTDNRGVVV